MSIQRLLLEGLSVEGHHPVERKPLVQGVPSAGLRITESYGDNLYCSWSFLERNRLHHSVTRKSATIGRAVSCSFEERNIVVISPKLCDL
jgi:hypothetical protein